jgi:hypothetical protein
MSYGAVSFSDIPLATGDSISAKFSVDKRADDSERRNWSCCWDSFNWSLAHRGKISENGFDNLCVFIRGFKIMLDEASYQQLFDNGGFPPTPMPKSELFTERITSQSTSSDSSTRSDGSGRGGHGIRSFLRRLGFWSGPSPRTSSDRRPTATVSSNTVYLDTLPGQSQVRRSPT